MQEPKPRAKKPVTEEPPVTRKRKAIDSWERSFRSPIRSIKFAVGSTRKLIVLALTPPHLESAQDLDSLRQANRRSGFAMVVNGFFALLLVAITLIFPKTALAYFLNLSVALVLGFRSFVDFYIYKTSFQQISAFKEAPESDETIKEKIDA
jgi:hypothetical protein